MWETPTMEPSTLGWHTVASAATAFLLLPPPRIAQSVQVGRSVVASHAPAGFSGALFLNPRQFCSAWETFAM